MLLAFNKTLIRCLTKLLKNKRGLGAAEKVFIVGAGVALAAGFMETFSQQITYAMIGIDSDMIEALDILFSPG